MAVIFAGSYERFLFGFNAAHLNDDMAASSTLTKAHTYAAHQGPVKCCAGAGHYVVTGGQDDLIHLYNIKTGTDLGFLVNPGRGAITSLEFFVPPGAGGAPSHLLSGSEDGTISIWQVGGEWPHLKQLLGHTAAVMSLAVHPSGRLALSISKDRTIRMWNLLKGRCSYTTKLDKEAEVVKWSPSGESYALVCDTLVTILKASGGGELLASLRHPRRVASVLMASDAAVLTGAEDGSLRLWDVRPTVAAATAAHAASSGQPVLVEEQRTPVHEVAKAHATRIRGLIPLGGVGSNGLPAILATCCSLGHVKLWDLRRLSALHAAPGEAISGSVACTASVSTTARLTCLCAADPSVAASVPPPPPAAAKAAVAAAAAAAATAPPKRQQARRKNLADVKDAADGSKKRTRPTAVTNGVDFEIVPAEGATTSQRLPSVAAAAGPEPEDDDDGIAGLTLTRKRQRKQPARLPGPSKATQLQQQWQQQLQGTGKVTIKSHKDADTQPAVAPAAAAATMQLSPAAAKVNRQQQGIAGIAQCLSAPNTVAAAAAVKSQQRHHHVRPGAKRALKEDWLEVKKRLPPPQQERGESQRFRRPAEKRNALALKTGAIATLGGWDNAPVIPAAGNGTQMALAVGARPVTGSKGGGKNRR